jgi:regulator of RNase E activity RraB
MPDNWKSYLCNVNNNLASVFVNLGLRDDAPISSQPWLLWAWVYFQSPRPDGLSDGREAPTLFKIEDALDLHVSRSCGAIPCGRITTEGRREFYFYGETKDGFADAVAAALAGFNGYKFDSGEKEDSLWEQYLDVLYPSPEDLERIKNRDVLDVLVERGDVLTAVRDVQHWMYFSSEASRAHFRDAAIGAGFRIDSESIVEGSRPFGISVVRSQPVQQELIDATVIELLQMTQRFDGEYDGWETPLVTQ